MKLVGIIMLAAVIIFFGVAIASTTQVLIEDFEFHPGSVTINKGDTVTWTHPGPRAIPPSSRPGVADSEERDIILEDIQLDGHLSL